MEGAEGFDFFRQPDFVKDPFLKGSYAVYKKETLAGEGTGKLCHIHRPLIIDSRGRRVWGELSVDGDRLCIAVPETWLSGAEYPVIVDPTIGTATVGSQTVWEQDPGDWVPVSNEFCIPVNRFLVSETVNGLCTAYFYAYSNEEPDSAGYPVLYSDNGNKPLSRRSAQESYIDLQVKSGKAAGWRSGTMRTNGSITGGSYIWFGISTDIFWYSRFDYGSKLYRDTDYDDLLPDTYPLFNANNYYDFKLSMYFTYSAAQQNYVRTLTQGVKLADGRKPAASYQRTAAVDAGSTMLLDHSSNYFRERLEDSAVFDTLSRFRGFFCSLAEQITAGGFTASRQDFLRTAAFTLRPETAEGRKLSVRREVTSQAGILDGAARLRGFIRTLAAGVAAGDYAGKASALYRAVREGAAALGETGRIGDYLRGIYTEAGNTAEAVHRGEYYRIQQDTAGSGAASLRRLFIFIRLLTASYIRDYLIGRFLRSKEELVIKSPVRREITLDSSLH
jgi:hypothetical protein